MILWCLVFGYTLPQINISTYIQHHYRTNSTRKNSLKPTEMCIYSKIISVTDTAVYFKHVISGKHNIPVSINLPTIPFPRRNSDKKKKCRVCDQKLTCTLRVQCTECTEITLSTTAIILYLNLCNTRNIAFSSITSLNTVEQCSVSRP